MQWQSNIRILGVNCGSGNAHLYFANHLGIVGWREVWATADGVNRIVATAIAAQYAGRIVRLYIANDGRILAIQTI